MEDYKNSAQPTQTQPAFWRIIAPIILLIFFSPVLTELLAGIIHITNLWLLLPEMAVYGLAALLIREAVRRQGRGWITVLLLGIAYALTEECVILQTSLTPQFFPNGTASFGWAFGVQWLYLFAMLGYESVYAIVLPIALTEILFPNRRNTPWLDKRGIIVAIVVFLIGALGVWWLWSHVGVRRYGSTDYHIPYLTIGLALLVIFLLVAIALLLPARVHPPRHTTRRAWSPWLLWDSSPSSSASSGGSWSPLPIYPLQHFMVSRPLPLSSSACSGLC
jgi:uncharacterized membrane protein YeaQ/YmgE (transglycosylase-associated protein family)